MDLKYGDTDCEDVEHVCILRTPFGPSPQFYDYRRKNNPVQAMSEKASFLSMRNREKFAYNGYLFTFEKLDSTGTIKFWRCDRRSSCGCKARLHTSVATDDVVKELNVHSHEGDHSRVEVAAICSAAMRRAQETNENPSVIIEEAFQQMPFNAISQMPTRVSMSKCIRRRRASMKVKNEPLEPASRATMAVHENYLACADGDRFLLYDSGPKDENRILIFGRDSYGAWSGFMKSLYSDGTYDIASPLFPHAFILTAERGGFFIPVLYALLPDKLEATYSRVFSVIKELWPDFVPETISLDFECAVMKAAKAVFPAAKVIGSFVHLVRRMKIQLTELNLLDRYNSDAEFARYARMLMSLAFVPSASLEGAFEELSNDSPEAFAPMLNWFEEKYIGRPNRFGGRRIPQFPTHIWSLYQKILMGEGLTNELLDTAYRRMRMELASDQPTIWKFVDRFRILQQWADQQYEYFVAGKEPRKWRSWHVRTDEQIHQKVKQFESDKAMQFLGSVAELFSSEF